MFECETGLPTLILTVGRVGQQQHGSTRGADESANSQRPGVGEGAGTKKKRENSKKPKKEFDESADMFYILQNVKYVCRFGVEFVRQKDRRACEQGGEEMRRRLGVCCCVCCGRVSQEFRSSLSLKKNAAVASLLRLGESGIWEHFSHV